MNREPKTATPTEAPIVRDIVTADGAAPRSAVGALFWAMTVVICCTQPIPSPRTTMNSEVVNRLVPTVIVDRPTAAAVISTVPITGKILYRPVALIVRPTSVVTTTTGTIRGSRSNPELAAVAPWTLCWNSGR